jgi:indole-3-glycerol phosphate synthase
MKGTILEKIIDSKCRRVEAAKAGVDRSDLAERASAVHKGSEPHRLRKAISDKNKISIIAEFKRASPSKGLINGTLEPASVAAEYELGGAAAVSVLTEEDHFQGSIDDLRAVRSAVKIPVLRKDFIFDPFQVYEAAAAGADAILLIAAVLDDSQLRDLEALAEDELGMDALIEVHNLEELERVAESGSKLIGVNNRDLRTFSVSLDVSRELILHAPNGSLMIAESGLTSRHDILELKGLGYSGFLIGETLMRSDHRAEELKRLSDQG